MKYNTTYLPIKLIVIFTIINCGCMKYFLLLLLPVFFLKASCQDSLHSKLYFTSAENSRVHIGATYYYKCTAFDSSRGALLYSAETLPAWLTFNTATHVLAGKATKTGQYAVTLAVSNGAAIAHQHFMLTVFDAHTVNIACIGNSITNGTSTYNSYRRALWQMLHKAGYNFDMVGSWSKHHAGGPVPNPDFDMDHDGHSGWNAAHIFNPPDWDSARGNINQWLTMYTIDIALVELGTNDVFQCRTAKDVIANLTTLVNVLRKQNGQVKILIAQIPPLGVQWAPKKLCGDSIGYSTRIYELNTAILALTHKLNNHASPVIAVDQFTGVNPATDMYDDIHPNTKGEEEMAKRWFDKIKNFL